MPENPENKVAEKILSLEEREKLRRMNWSVVVRYIMVVIIVAITLLGYQVGFNYYIPGILVAVTIAFIYNLISSFFYTSVIYPRWWPYAGIFLDMVIITFIVHFTGGIESIFLVLYLLQIVGTNVHFSRLAGPLNLIFGAGIFIALIFLEQKGILPHYSSNVVPYGLYQNLKFIFLASLTLVIFMGISAYRSGYVVHSLQSVEEKFFKLNEELIRANRSMSESNRRLKELDQMKTEFISVASHQMRTPLSAIKWILKMVIDGDLGALTQEQKDLLAKGYQSNERMIALINDLLNVSRIEEGRFQYRMMRMSAEDVIEKVIEEMKSDIQTKHIRFKYNRPTTPTPKVSIDPQKIHLVLQNLIDNALKYTPSRGRIEINLQAEKELLFSIKDNGVGIPSSQREKIFSKFFRADNVVRMQTEGSGLGLFIVKNIIQAHGGRVWFESQEGIGTTFYFALPYETSGSNLSTTKKFEQFIQKI